MGCSCSCSGKPDIINQDLFLSNEVELTYYPTDRNFQIFKGLSIDNFQTQLSSRYEESTIFEDNFVDIPDLKKKKSNKIELENANLKSKFKLKFDKVPKSCNCENGYNLTQSGDLAKIKDQCNSNTAESTISSPRFLISAARHSTQNSPMISTLMSDNLKESLPRRYSSRPLDNKLIIFIVFPPGIVKDDAIFPLFRSYGFENINIEKLIQEQGISNELWGKKIKKCLSSGKEIPSHILVSLLLEKINNSSAYYILLSGFPKNEDQASCWRKAVKNRINVIAVVMITYTRKEYESEITAMAEKQGKRISFKEAVVNFDYFIQNTYKLCNYFGASKCLKISATLKEDLIAVSIMKSDIVSSKLNINRLTQESASLFRPMGLNLNNNL